MRDPRPGDLAALPECLRNVCSRCGYNLASLPVDAPCCPECGTPIADARGGEGRASLLSMLAIVLATLSLLCFGCSSGVSVVLAIPGMALGLWARARAMRGEDTPVSASLAMGAITLSGIVLAITGFVLLNLLIMSMF